MGRRFAGLTVLMLLSVTAAFGCGKKDAETGQTQPISKLVVETETETEAETGLIVPEGKAISHLTGEIVDVTVNNRRPAALMINNVQEALPQSGLSQADILYEAVVEGRITRLMAVFQNYESLEKVGPIRSARHYYLDFAHDEEAFYGHFGWSIFAENRIYTEGLKTLHLMAGDRDLDYYRASDRVAPHNVYVTGAQLAHAIERFGIDTALPEHYESRLNFFEKDTQPTDGQKADIVDIPTSSQSRLEYDAQNKVYKKFQYGGPHMDDVDQSQLTFKNIIIQYAPYTCIDAQSDCQDIALTGTGTGIYITDGRAMDITWEKVDLTSDYTRYYTQDGEALLLNPGKSYIAVLPVDYKVTLS